LGFKIKSTTEKATYKLMNEILKALNNKPVVKVTYVILKKLVTMSTTICHWKKRQSQYHI